MPFVHLFVALFFDKNQFKNLVWPCARTCKLWLGLRFLNETTQATVNNGVGKQEIDEDFVLPEMYNLEKAIYQTDTFLVGLKSSSECVCLMKKFK